MKLIGIVGKHQVGKTTLAKNIQEWLENEGYNIRFINFADYIKEIVWNILDEKLTSKYETEESKNAMLPCGISKREAFEVVGEKLRQIDPGCWIRKVRKDINASPGYVYIIGDIYRQNEIDFIKEYDGFLIKLKQNKTKCDNVYEKTINIKDTVDYNICLNNELLAPQETFNVVKTALNKKFINKKESDMVSDYAFNQFDFKKGRNKNHTQE